MTKANSANLATIAKQKDNFLKLAVDVMKITNESGNDPRIK